MNNLTRNRTLQGNKPQEQSISEMCRTPCLRCLHRELAFACTCVCARTQRHRQEKQSRLLILHCATSHLRQGRKQHCPNQGPCKHGNYKQKGHSSQKTHPLLPASALSSNSASTWGLKCQRAALCQTSHGWLFFNWRKVPSESPLSCRWIASGKFHHIIPSFGGSFAQNNQAPEQKPKQTESQAANLNDNETKSQSWNKTLKPQSEFL